VFSVCAKFISAVDAGSSRCGRVMSESQHPMNGCKRTMRANSAQWIPTVSHFPELKMLGM
jgi:hypothetical protein